MSAAAPYAEEVCLGSVELIPPGEGRRFIVGEHEIAVFRQRDGRVFAAGDRCPHQDGPLAEGVLGGGQVICPYHSYRFDLATGACLNDSACSIPIYPVRQEGELLLLTLGHVDVGTVGD